MKRHLISASATIIEALSRLNDLSGEAMTLFVTDENGVISGTLTDGDIRRALLRGVSVNDSITEAMNPDFHFLNHGAIDVEDLKSLRQKRITLLPVVDSSRHIVDLIDLSTTKSRLPLSAIIMAGGIGERLRPLTLKTPKPLLKVDGKPIIDYNIEALAAVGITDITVATRYLADQLHEHFSVPVGGVKVKCVTETTPLGTIGAATLVDLHDDGTTLIMNSDLLTSISFEDMYLKHISENASITIAAIPYVVSVPYAILETTNERVTSIEEKPTYSYYANAGIYIIDNRLLKKLPQNFKTDATTLIEQAIADGERIAYFPINGTWIDIGSPADYKQAEELMKHYRNFQN